MRLASLVARVRSYTRDTTGTLFTTSDVKDFVNEGIDRLRQIKQLEGMKHLTNDMDEPNLLPSQYHYMIALYSAYRCFAQDEQYVPAQSYADEFETLFREIEHKIQDGRIVIVDEANNEIKNDVDFDSVTNVYFNEVRNNG